MDVGSHSFYAKEANAFLEKLHRVDLRVSIFVAATGSGTNIFYTVDDLTMPLAIFYSFQSKGVMLNGNNFHHILSKRTLVESRDT